MSTATASGRPHLVPAYVAGLAVVAWPLTWWMAVSGGTTPGWQAGILTATVLLTGWAPLRLQRGGDAHGVTTDEAIVVALLAIGAAPWAGLLLGAAVVFGHILLGARPTKVLFNGTQVALAGSAAGATFQAMGAPTAVLSPEWLLALAAGLAVYAAIGLAAMTVLFRLLDGRPVRVLVAESWRVLAISTAGNLLFGVVLAFLVATDERMTVVGVALALAVQVGSRGYVRIVDDRARSELLQDTTRALVEVAGDPRRLGDVLVRLTALFGGRRAELLLLAPTGTRHLAATPAGVEHDPEQPLDPAVHEALDRGGHVLRPTSDDGTSSAMAVPIVYESRVMGALAVLDRHGLEPWSQIDLGLLASLAHEAAVALRTIDLFEDVRLERQRFADESRKLSDVVNATSDGIVTVDLAGKVTVWNDAIAAITGTAAEDALGRPWFTVLRLRDDHDRDLGDQQRNVITQVLVDSVPASGVNLQVLRRDGQWRWLRCTLNPVVSQEGTTGVVVVARDVTADVEIEQMKADFLATVSHELRTPLTPLLGFVETLERFGAELSDDQRSRSLGAMRSQLQRLGRLVEDLLTTAELDRGVTRLAATPVALGEAARAAVAAVPAAERPRVQLTVEHDAAVLGDRPALDRILGELVGNALKHTAGPVAVRVGVTDEGTHVSVTDHGPGIAPSDHARVFERFGRLGDHLHRPQGPGLGLPIARGLAEELGGRIELDSDVDRGSTFTLTLPAAEPDARAGGPLSAVN